MAGRCAGRPRGVPLPAEETLAGRGCCCFFSLFCEAPTEASCSKEMSTPTQDFWNYIPEELLVHIFSYLPFEDRHTAFSVCKRWAAALCIGSVWSSTEISCNPREMSQPCLLQSLHLFLRHIKHLKILLDQTRQLYRRNVTRILDMLTWQNQNVQALSIVCSENKPFFYSCPDIMQSFRKICGNTGKIDLQYIDFRKTPFTLDNGLVRRIATSNPNLHTLLINNHPPRLIILRPKTIAEVLRVCPKLSALGVHHATLSEGVFRELLKPSRGPFRFLDIFCEGVERYIPEGVWSALTEKHPQLRVGLEFGPLVPTWKMSRILLPNIPVATLRFNCRTYMVQLIRFVTANYSRTLERLIFYSAASGELNDSLIELAKRCVHLKEIHCSCAVSQAVIDAFLLYCPGLIRYTLSKFSPF
ncbi:F-box/LRR-repeat protein 8-like isoform X2 [Hemicordylus capensis]|uniref:F-box/LRR-repeat protein 8-like isoform X2 n=1 Tax=Hemicordylus capensis TaxID=884348 RepID=UPI002303965F|nr:F-box/LRR-repeat protein 8-like isoform X2 [Hemicordylus capensis]